MEEMNHSAIHAKRVTIMPKDLALVSRLSGTNAYQNYGLQKPSREADLGAPRAEAAEPGPPRKRPAAQAEGPEGKRKRKKKDGWGRAILTWQWHWEKGAEMLEVFEGISTKSPPSTGSQDNL